MDNYKFKHQIPFLLFFVLVYFFFISYKKNKQHIFFTQGLKTNAYIYDSELEIVQNNTIYLYRFNYGYNEYNGSTEIHPFAFKRKLHLHDTITVYFLPNNPYKNISGYDLYNTFFFKKNKYQCEYFLCE
jgi:hypothetical protein